MIARLHDSGWTTGRIDRSRRRGTDTAMVGHLTTDAVALALFQPDIPQNTATMLRLAACLGVPAHIVGPAGFRSDDRALKRSGMDYLAAATINRHPSWTEFDAWRREERRRLILATTKARTPYTKHRFVDGDIILVGRESAGVPDTVHDACDARIVVPMVAGMRSLNVATAAAMIVGEALRQTGGFVGDR